jgi:hypothetical protein
MKVYPKVSGLTSWRNDGKEDGINTIFTVLQPPPL